MSDLQDFLGNYSDPKYDYMNFMMNTAAEKHGLDPSVLKALIDVESQFNPIAKSKKGAVGLTQLMPRTAQSLGVVDRTNPQENITGGASYLRELLNRFGSLDKALGAYNYGPTNMATKKRLPSSVNNYVSKVKNRAGWLDKSKTSLSLADYLNIPLMANPEYTVQIVDEGK